ncbi:MAG: RNA polymerase sigma-70 factor [Prolixibacteraceae bacterium]
MDPDQIRIEDIQQGNSGAFRRFFEGFYPSACIFAKKYLNDTAVAEDAAQDAFIEFWKRKDQFSDYRAIKGYIYTVTRNNCLNQIKIKNLREGILRKEFASEEYFCEMIQEEETYRIIYQAVNGLAHQSRKIILLSLKGYKNPEIAEELQVSVNTVKTLKKNAYKELRVKLKDHIFILFMLNQFVS